MRKIIFVYWILLVLISVQCTKNQIKNTQIVNGLDPNTHFVLSVLDVAENATEFTHQGARTANNGRVNMAEGIPALDGKASFNVDLKYQIEGEKMRIQLPNNLPVGVNDQGEAFVLAMVYKKAIQLLDDHSLDLKTGDEKMTFVSQEMIVLKRQGNGFASFVLDPLLYQDLENPKQNYLLQFAILPNPSDYNYYTAIPSFALVRSTKDANKKVIFSDPLAWRAKQGDLHLNALARNSNEPAKHSFQCSTVESTREVRCVYKISGIRKSDVGLSTDASTEEIKAALQLIQIPFVKTKRAGYDLVYPNAEATGPGSDASLGSVIFDIYEIADYASVNNDVANYINIHNSSVIFDLEFIFSTAPVTRSLSAGRDGSQITTTTHGLLPGYKLQVARETEQQTAQKYLTPILYQPLTYPSAEERKDFLGNPQVSVARAAQIPGFKKHQKVLIAGFFSAATITTLAVLLGINTGKTIKETEIVTEIVTVTEFIEIDTDLATNIYKLQQAKTCSQKEIDLLNKISNSTTISMSQGSLEYKQAMYYGNTITNTTIYVYNDKNVLTKVSDFKGFDVASETCAKETQVQALVTEIKAKMQQTFPCTITDSYTSLATELCGLSTDLQVLTNSYFGIIIKNTTTNSYNLPIPYALFLREDTDLTPLETDIKKKVFNYDYVLSAPVNDYQALHQLTGVENGLTYNYYPLNASIFLNPVKKPYRIVTSSSNTINRMSSEFFYKKK